MSYNYTPESLFALLKERSPARANAVALHHRVVEHGLLSVGLKLHCLNEGARFSTLIEGLGGIDIVTINHYKNERASLCLVLPPVGSARTAIHLVRCIEEFTGEKIFNNSSVQVQICSPGRLDSRRSALLAIGFYLGSDILRRYTLHELETTFTTVDSRFVSERYYHRGRRLLLYDANGDFDRNFEWWHKSEEERIILPELPFEKDRTDLLTGRTEQDVRNINLLATLLVHAQYGGYWKELGLRFEHDMEELLKRHLLHGLIEAPWVQMPTPFVEGDLRFFSALQELVAYAFEEAERLKMRKLLNRFSNRRKCAAKPGILQEMRSLLLNYRHDLLYESRMLTYGGFA